MCVSEIQRAGSEQNYSMSLLRFLVSVGVYEKEKSLNVLTYVHVSVGRYVQTFVNRQTPTMHAQIHLSGPIRFLTAGMAR